MSIKSTFALGLSEVAAWQVQGLESRVLAALPAMQRGAIWKAAQTEKLWDSLLRGFPIGAFILSPFDEQQRGVASLRLGQCQDPQFHLLDGQQRATAIALAFYDLWSNEDVADRRNGPALWLDLAPPESNDDREYVFRVLTRSHPWGYNRKRVEDRLTHRQISLAGKAFREAAEPCGWGKTSEMHLANAWPWDAVAPIPVPLLINAVLSAEPIEVSLPAELEKLPFWKNAVLIDGCTLQNRLEAAIHGADPALKLRLDLIVGRFRELVRDEALITAQVLPPSPAIANSTTIDPVETLFVRINSSGTRLEGEELMYSLLKSAWTDAPSAMSKLQPDGEQWVSPSRLALLLARAIQVNDFLKNSDNKVEDYSKLPPASPDVSRFRSFLHQPGRLSQLKDFVDQDMVALWRDASTIIRMDTRRPDQKDYRLPPKLAAEFASGVAGHELLLILVTWLMRLRMEGKMVSDLSDLQRRRALGFLLAVRWFGKDIKECVHRIWRRLMKKTPSTLPDFFDKKLFQRLLPVTARNGIVMLPLISPDNLEKLFRLRIIEGSNGYPGIKSPESVVWGASNGWDVYHHRLVPGDAGLAGFEKLPSHLKEWLEPLSFEPREDIEGINEMTGFTSPRDIDAERKRLAWSHFFWEIWSNRSFVEYAQRHWLMKWFPDYDPTLPGQMEDVNRPWDYDHIHPDNFVSGRHRVPGMIRVWHSSIGNFRCWPLEVNRADQDDTPLHKLGGEVEQDEKLVHYGITSAKAIREASFIDDQKDWPYWQGAAPEDARGNYLAKPENRLAGAQLVRAISIRICRLYEHWYTSLGMAGIAP